MILPARCWSSGSDKWGSCLWCPLGRRFHPRCSRGRKPIFRPFDGRRCGPTWVQSTWGPGSRLFRRRLCKIFPEYYWHFQVDIFLASGIFPKGVMKIRRTSQLATTWIITSGLVFCHIPTRVLSHGIILEGTWKYRVVRQLRVHVAATCAWDAINTVLLS